VKVISMLLFPPEVPSQPPSINAGQRNSHLGVSSDPWCEYQELLRQAGLRPTRQRMVLAWMLFSNGNRHLTAEMLHDEAIRAKIPISLATIYNNLHQFTEIGLVQQIAVDGSKAFFDTNTAPHHHFFLIGEHALVDIPASHVVLGKVPEPPAGYEIARVDVVVRLRRRPGISK
jgi:Fur family transcriptional regulator, iron response regulator